MVIHLRPTELPPTVFDFFRPTILDLTLQGVGAVHPPQTQKMNKVHVYFVTMMIGVLFHSLWVYV